MKKPRHHSHLLSDETNLAKGKQGRITGADNSGSPPRLPANSPSAARPNEVTRVNGADKSDIVDKPGIVVIHPRTFFRDCFVRCLEISYKSHDIIAFANIYAWRASQDGTALNPSIIVFFVDGTDASSANDLQYLETAATNTPVIIVSDIDDVNYVVRALKGGARGYIPTSLSFNVAVEAVRLVEAGGTFVPVSSLAMDRSKETSVKTGDILTERQMMVVEALCQGMANKQIAYELGMSEHTVKVHLRHIMRKLRARNRTEVAVLTKDFFERPHEQKRSNTEDGPV
ncbi:two component transcriptional regulator, LuxR family [Bradyrhizobiaceae bacterium SG-6C]|nr:two component transcriptional regulator, LuxR family [Bradyrhizobiaceae bacterium SG-6C]